MRIAHDGDAVSRRDGIRHLVHITACQIQERSPPHPLHRAHCREGSRTRSAKQAQQDGFRLVITGVAEQYGLCAEGIGGLCQCGVTGGARSCLDPTVTAHVNHADEHWIEPERSTSLLRDSRHVGGRRLQLVIDDHRPGRNPLVLCHPCRCPSQRHGIRAARGCDEHPRGTVQGCGDRMSRSEFCWCDIHDTRASHCSGCSISSRVGNTSADDHTRLNPDMPRSAITARTKAAPWEY